jgi:hypothetical protein
VQIRNFGKNLSADLWITLQKEGGEEKGKNFEGNKKSPISFETSFLPVEKWRGWQDSNPRPSGS